MVEMVIKILYILYLGQEKFLCAGYHLSRYNLKTTPPLGRIAYQ
jgi:hypothetical protein